MRTMDKRVTAKIAGLYGQGANISEIAQKVGVTRQTVYKHLRSPELQGLFEEAQSGAMGVLAASNSLLLETIEEASHTQILPEDSAEVAKAKMALKREALNCARELAKVLNAKVIEQTPKGSASVETEALTDERRAELLAEIRQLTDGSENCSQNIDK